MDKGPFRNEGLKGVRFFKKGGPYEFLRNEYEFPFEYEINGEKYTFRNATAAFLARKAPGRAKELSALSAEDAKALSAKFKKGKTTNEIDPEFEEHKVEIMEDVLRAKFANPTLADKLVSVPGRVIVNGIFACERFWGTPLANLPGTDLDIAGRGKNYLGRLLTKLRDEKMAEKGMPNPYKKYEPFVYKVQHGGYITFDTETTGKGQVEEILQITIVGQYGELLLSTYIKPEGCVFWDEAQKVTDITPDFIEDHGASRDAVAKATREIFEAADVIVGHNVTFDKRMVSACFGEKPWEEYSFEDRQKRVLKRIFKSENTSAFYKRYFENAKDSVVDFIRYVQSEFGVGKTEKALLDTFKLEGKAKSGEEILYSKLKAFFKADRKLDKDLKEDDGTYLKVSFKKTILSLDDEDIENLAEILLPDVTTFDTLHYFKTSGMKTESGNYKLCDLVKELLPMKFSDFENGAHNAEVDTKYTALIADVIASSDAPSALKDVFPPKFSVENLYGIKDGFLVNYVPTDEKGFGNFSKRLFEHYPAAKKSFTISKNKYADADLVGKIALSEEVEGRAKIANLFGDKAHLSVNEPSFVSAISKLCAYAEKQGSCVYIPVVTEKKGDRATVLDGCGFDRGELSNEQYSAVLNGFMKGLPNLRLVDTQNGDIIEKDFRVWGEIPLPTDMLKDDIEIC